MPMAARTPAAPTAGIPKSAQSGMKCTWIKPLVLAPQMKNVANRIQNTRVRAASRSAASGAVASGGAAETQSHPPADTLGQVGENRQEYQLPGRRARGQQPDHEAAALGEPLGR